MNYGQEMRKIRDDNIYVCKMHLSFISVNGMRITRGKSQSKIDLTASHLPPRNSFTSNEVCPYIIGEI